MDSLSLQIKPLPLRITKLISPVIIAKKRRRRRRNPFPILSIVSSSLRRAISFSKTGPLVDILFSLHHGGGGGGGGSGSGGIGFSAGGGGWFGEEWFGRRRGNLVGIMASIAVAWVLNRSGKRVELNLGARVLGLGILGFSRVRVSRRWNSIGALGLGFALLYVLLRRRKT